MTSWRWIRGSDCGGMRRSGRRRVGVRQPRDGVGADVDARLRVAHVYRESWKVRGDEDPVPGSHHSAVQEAQSHRRRLLDACRSPTAENTLVYILAHESREAAKKNWAAFIADPVRKQVWADTEKDGPINMKVESVYLNPTEFSPVK